MTDFNFKPTPVPDHLDSQVLASLSDDIIESALVGYVAKRSGELASEEQALASISPALRTWYITFVVDAEVLNGGFNQLFFNQSAGASEEAPAAFEAVGLPKGVELMKRALALLKGHVWTLKEARDEGTVEAFMATYKENPFRSLDDEYCKHEEDFQKQRIRFLRAQAENIRDP